MWTGADVDLFNGHDHDHDYLRRHPAVFWRLYLTRRLYWVEEMLRRGWPDGLRVGREALRCLGCDDDTIDLCGDDDDQLAGLLERYRSACAKVAGEEYEGIPWP